MSNRSSAVSAMGKATSGYYMTSSNSSLATSSNSSLLYTMFRLTFLHVILGVSSANGEKFYLDGIEVPAPGQSVLLHVFHMETELTGKTTQEFEGIENKNDVEWASTVINPPNSAVKTNTPMSSPNPKITETYVPEADPPKPKTDTPEKPETDPPPKPKKSPYLESDTDTPQIDRDSASIPKDSDEKNYIPPPPREEPINPAKDDWNVGSSTDIERKEDGTRAKTDSSTKKDESKPKEDRTKATSENADEDSTKDKPATKKDESTTKKDESTTKKDESTTKKDESATKKDESAAKKDDSEAEKDSTTKKDESTKKQESASKSKDEKSEPTSKGEKSASKSKEERYDSKPKEEKYESKPKEEKSDSNLKKEEPKPEWKSKDADSETKKGTTKKDSDSNNVSGTKNDEPVTKKKKTTKESTEEKPQLKKKNDERTAKKVPESKSTNGGTKKDEPGLKDADTKSEKKDEAKSEKKDNQETKDPSSAREKPVKSAKPESLLEKSESTTAKPDSTETEKPATEKPSTAAPTTKASTTTISTTKAPANEALKEAETRKAPDTTKRPDSITTTKAPDTTKASDIKATTKASGSTTQKSEETTRAPVSTTKAPAEPKKTEITTAASKTTEAPKKEAGKATQAPKKETTAPPTTVAATPTKPAAPTTAAPTTVAVTTTKPAAPTTAAPTTVVATTTKPAAPTTAAPTTVAATITKPAAPPRVAPTPATTAASKPSTVKKEAVTTGKPEKRILSESDTEMSNTVDSTLSVPNPGVSKSFMFSAMFSKSREVFSPMIVSELGPLRRPPPLRRLPIVKSETSERLDDFSFLFDIDVTKVKLIDSQGKISTPNSYAQEYEKYLYTVIIEESKFVNQCGGFNGFSNMKKLESCLCPPDNDILKNGGHRLTTNVLSLSDLPHPLKRRKFTIKGEKYLLILVNCRPQFTPAMTKMGLVTEKQFESTIHNKKRFYTGEISVQYNHGYLSGITRRKYTFYKTLFNLYAGLGLIWGGIWIAAKLYYRKSAPNAEVNILLVHKYLTHILILCLAECAFWIFKYYHWQSSGSRNWGLMFLARIAYSLKVGIFWIMIQLIVAKCCGVYRLILSTQQGKNTQNSQVTPRTKRKETCSILSIIRANFGERSRRVMLIAVCYFTSEVFYQAVSIHRNQITFIAPQDRSSFRFERLFFGVSELTFVSFIALYILKTLREQKINMEHSNNESLILAYERMTKLLQVTFILKITCQVFKFMYYPVKLTFYGGSTGSGSGSTGISTAPIYYDLGDSYWYLEVVLPHCWDFLILFGLFLIWYPRPEFSHVDNEDSKLEMAMENYSSQSIHLKSTTSMESGTKMESSTKRTTQRLDFDGDEFNADVNDSPKGSNRSSPKTVGVRTAGTAAGTTGSGSGSIAGSYQNGVLDGRINGSRSSSINSIGEAITKNFGQTAGDIFNQLSDVFGGNTNGTSGMNNTVVGNPIASTTSAGTKIANDVASNSAASGTSASTRNHQGTLIGMISSFAMSKPKKPTGTTLDGKADSSTTKAGSIGGASAGSSGLATGVSTTSTGSGVRSGFAARNNKAKPPPPPQPDPFDENDLFGNSQSSSVMKRSSPTTAGGFTSSGFQSFGDTNAFGMSNSNAGFGDFDSAFGNSNNVGSASEFGSSGGFKTAAAPPPPPASTPPPAVPEVGAVIVPGPIKINFAKKAKAEPKKSRLKLEH